jgi:hypothetical protein
MSKQKRFEPSMGFIVAINVHEVAVRRVSRELDLDPITLGQALERAGYRLEPDPFDISADTWKVIQTAIRQDTTKLEVVKNESADNTSND